jgi:hypothetical protein
MTDLRNDWQALRREVRRLYEDRLAANVWPRTKSGKLTKAGDAQAFDWLLGIHVGLTLSGDEAGLGPLVFLASVRGVEDATRIKED